MFSGHMPSAVLLSGRSSSLLFRSYGSLSHRLLLGSMVLRKGASEKVIAMMNNKIRFISYIKTHVL